MNTEQVKLTKLKVNPQNPRTITKDKFEKLINSILVFPKMLEIRPIVVDGSYTALGGNQRTEALKAIAKMEITTIAERLTEVADFQRMSKAEQEDLIRYWDAWLLGDRKVSVIKADQLSEDEKKQFVIKDNSGFGAYDWDMLANEWDAELLSDWGLDLPSDWDTTEEQKEAKEDDFTEEDAANVETRVKAGEIWQLGEHRLMCGDSTKKEDVERLMDGEKADMVFTDPPYGVSYEGGHNKKKKKQIKNDDLKGDVLYEFLFDVFCNLKEFSKEKSGIYVFYTTNNTRQFINAFCESGLKQRSIIAWHKLGGGFGDFMAQYMNAYEPCIYGSNGDAVRWYGQNNEKTIWEIEKEKKCDLHPTMKPIPLVSRAVSNSSKEKDIVLDLFGGSGSTLITCEQLNRVNRSMELDPHYCDVIIARWEKLTGKEAVKIYG